MSDTTHRSAWSILVVVAFLAATGVLVATWFGAERSTASFSDQEVFGTNRLGAGTVDVAVGDGTVGFAAVNMAPGDVATGRVEIVNRGTLPFRYSLSSTAGDGPLLGVLDLIAWRSDTTCPTEPPVDAVRWEPLIDESGTAAGASGATLGRLTPGATQLLCLRATLPLSAPNRYQGERLALVVTVDAVQDVPADDADGRTVGTTPSEEQR